VLLVDGDELAWTALTSVAGAVSVNGTGSFTVSALTMTTTGSIVSNGPALNLTVQAQILSLLDTLRRERDTGILFITHDFGVVSAICDRIAVMYAGQVVETGTTEQILSKPAHPYTAKLIDCVPVLGEPDRRLDAISGRPPLVNDLPRGCAFAPRCFQAREECRETSVGLSDVGEARQARCLFPLETAGAATDRKGAQA
jgi:peptide/nickel transport system permease protein